jgi:N-methylhydantoinase A
MTGGSARIGVDIGGTFTDLVLIDDAGEVFFMKVSSTPAEPERAVIEGVGRIIALAGIAPGAVVEVLHGTTVGSNTLLQKAGAPTGLITTKGFRDVLEIGRVRTPDMFNLAWEKPAPLIPRRHRREVDERVAADGSVLVPLDPAEVVALGEAFTAAGLTSIAICFINSYRNPQHEIAAERILAAHFPRLFVTTSASVLPEMKEYERTSTTAVNAYVRPILEVYLRRLESSLREIGIAAPILVSNSNGGLAAARTAQEKPVFFISSGRAAGVVGAANLGRAAREKDLIAFDMGGTTASASLVHDGVVTRTSEYEFRAGISTPSRFIKAGGYMMAVPTVDVAEIGSGAGSIAWIDDGGLLNVGPVSAGADPGPACYGIGGDRPTVTDANLVLGFLPLALAGGALRLDAERSRRVIERDLARPLGLGIEDAALGVREVVNANMARTIRAVTVERGVDPRDFTLVAFGGSGPVHACDLARTLDIRRVLVPKTPGVFTAMGMLAADVERYFIRACPGLLSALDAAEVNRLAAALRIEAEAALKGEGFSDAEIAYQFEADLRFRAQESVLALPIQPPFDGAAPQRMREAFLAAYRAIYQYASEDAIEMVSLRLIGRGTRAGKLDFATVGRERLRLDPPPEPTRRAYFDRAHGWREVPVLDCAALTGPVAGPAILESTDSTIVLPPGAVGEADRSGNIVVALAP